MSSSPKSKRTPPNNRFEDYVLTYEVGPGTGLYPVSSQAMAYVEGTAGLPYYINGRQIISLGFDFNFDGKIYKSLAVFASGWCVLVDPLRTSTNQVLGDVGVGGTGSYNGTISDSFSTRTHVLLAVWFDALRNTWRFTNDVGPSGTTPLGTYLTSLGISSLADLNSGKITTPAGIDSTSGGVKYYRGESGDSGKYFLVRWKSFSYNKTESTNIILFDLVIYENGKIEFRYSPRLGTPNDDAEGATIGIFANGESVSSPRYRDFSSLLRPDSRPKHVNGGSEYDGSYTELDEYTGDLAKYGANLSTRLHWPGVGQFGAVFRFSPPAIRRRQNRSILNLRESASFVSDGSPYFNDQNTIPFTSQVVEYPTMLPANLRTSYNSSQAIYVNELYTSGSIQVTRTLSPGMFDSVLEDALLDGRRRSGQ